MENWQFRSYLSGSHIVTTDDPASPHYYIHANNRRQVSLELLDFLNHGNIPKWMERLKHSKMSKECCTGPDGINISAVGPLILPEDDGKLNWTTCMSIAAIHAREELINNLLKVK